MQKFLNGKNANNKVSHWSLELATYNTNFEWISDACIKVADCMSRLVEVPKNDAPTSSILVNMVTASLKYGPMTHTHSKTKAPLVTSPGNSKVNAPQLLMRNCREILIQMQWMGPFCKYISRWLINGKTPHHESDTFTHIDGLLYNHAMDASQRSLALVILKSWCFMVLVEAHVQLHHQGVTRTYHLFKQQYYWKVINIDIHKYIPHCALCRIGKVNTQMYPLQMTDIPDWLFDKRDLIAGLNVSTSGNQHTLTLINHLTGWPEHFQFLIK